MANAMKNYINVIDFLIACKLQQISHKKIHTPHKTAFLVAIIVAIHHFAKHDSMPRCQAVAATHTTNAHRVYLPIYIHGLVLRACSAISFARHYRPSGKIRLGVVFWLMDISLRDYRVQIVRVCRMNLWQQQQHQQQPADVVMQLKYE